MGIRKALTAVSRVLDGRVGDDRRGFPRYPYNAGSAGLVDGAGYPASKWGVGVGDWSPDIDSVRCSSIQVPELLDSDLYSGTPHPFITGAPTGNTRKRR